MPHSAAKKFFKKRRKQNVAHPQNGILLSYEKEEQTHAPTWMKLKDIRLREKSQKRKAT